jgi:hypothetical protein
MRWLSRADGDIADVVNGRGARIRGKELTATQVDSWDERGALPDKTVIHPGQPVSGSDVRCPESTFDVVEALAQALDQNPRSFHRAVLVVAGRQLDVGTHALRHAYGVVYPGLRKFLSNARQKGARLRLPPGVLTGPLDSLTRDTLFELLLDESPPVDGIDALVKVLGLPSDLLTFPPDPEARDYPPFIEIARAGLALQVLPKEARTADSDDLKWATHCLRTLLCFTLLLAEFVKLTDSPLPMVPDPDPAVVRSADHVLRTLIAGGRAIGLLLKWAGAGSAEYLAALAAPMLLAILRVLPARARTDFQDSADRASVQLPRLLARLSLVEATPPELRHLLSFDAANRLHLARPDEQDAVRTSALAWSKGHPTEVALLTEQGTVTAASAAQRGSDQ